MDPLGKSSKSQTQGLELKTRNLKLTWLDLKTKHEQTVSAETEIIKPQSCAGGNADAFIIRIGFCGVPYCNFNPKPYLNYYKAPTVA